MILQWIEMVKKLKQLTPQSLALGKIKESKMKTWKEEAMEIYSEEIDGLVTDFLDNKANEMKVPSLSRNGQTGLKTNTKKKNQKTMPRKC